MFKISSVQLTHSKKLFNLGLRCQFEKLSPDKIIFNYSNRILTPEEKEALSHGLKYGLIPPKINYSKIFLSFEKFFYNIKQEQIYDVSGDGKNIVQNKVKDIAFSLYYGFDPRKLPPGNKNLINTLKSLSQDTSIVIMKPDKGNGIVILNRDEDDYVKKTKAILEDHSKLLLKIALKLLSNMKIKL